MARYGRNDGWKWALAVLAVLVLAVALMAGMTKGFKDWNPYGWFDKKQEETDPQECEHEYKDGIHICIKCNQVTGHEFGADGKCTICGEKAVEHTVTLELNGGEGEKSVTVRAGAALNVQAPTKEGYDFTGWYKDAALKEPYDEKTPVTAALTLYAGWKEKTVTIRCFREGEAEPYAMRRLKYGEQMEFEMIGSYGIERKDCGVYYCVYTREEAKAGAEPDGTLIDNFNIPKQYLKEDGGKTYLYTLFTEDVSALYTVTKDLDLYGRVVPMSEQDGGKHTYENGVCTECGYVCTHEKYTGNVCDYCGHDKTTETPAA